MAVKMNLRIKTKNHAADPEKGFLAKSISKSNGYATAMPTAWELTRLILQNLFTGQFIYSTTEHPPICHVFTTKKIGDKSGFGDKSGEM